VKLDTNGCSPKIISELLSKKLVDYIAMDIKNPLKKMKEIV
jgi:pyruvate formate lyase activating enzyme